MIRTYWIKFAGERPERWNVTNFDEFWHTLREHMLNRQLILEWIIID